MLLVVLYTFVFAITVNESLGCFWHHTGAWTSGNLHPLHPLNLRQVNISMRNQYLVESISFPCLKQFDFK